MNFFDYFILYYVQHIFGATYIITELASCLCISLVFEKVPVKNYKDGLILLLDFLITSPSQVHERQSGCDFLSPFLTAS